MKEIYTRSEYEPCEDNNRLSRMCKALIGEKNIALICLTSSTRVSRGYQRVQIYQIVRGYVPLERLIWD